MEKNKTNKRLCAICFLNLLVMLGSFVAQIWLFFYDWKLAIALTLIFWSLDISASFKQKKTLNDLLDIILATLEVTAKKKKEEVTKNN